MTSPHHHSHPASAPHAHGHQHVQKPVVDAEASWLLHSAAWRGLWALLVCAGVVVTLAWAMGGQG